MDKWIFGAISHTGVTGHPSASLVASLMSHLHTETVTEKEHRP